MDSPSVREPTQELFEPNGHGFTDFEGSWSVLVWGCRPHEDDACSTGSAAPDEATARLWLADPLLAFRERTVALHPWLELRRPDGSWRAVENPGYDAALREREDREPPVRECHHLDWWDATHGDDYQPSPWERE